MKLPARSKQKEIDIEDYYSVRVGMLWKGLKQEHICFWALCAYFLFEYVRPQSIYPAISIIPWAQIFFLVALGSVFTDKTVRWNTNIENKLIVIFFIIILLSGIFAFRPSASWERINQFINWFLLYFLVINIVNTERRLFVFILAYMIFNFKMSQHGFFSWAGRGFSFRGWGLIGAPGWFRNSGEFAIQMLIFSALSMAFVIALKEKWGRYKKWFFYFMPFTAVMSVIGSSSRGAQLALLVMGAWVLLKIKSGLKALVAVIVVMVLLFQFLPEEQKQRFSNMGEDKTSSQRLFYWEAGIDFLQDHPVLGIGYGNWTDYYRFALPEAAAEGLISVSHNIFVQAGAELGYTGLICFILMISFVFVLNARARKRAKQLGNSFLYFISYGLDAGLIGYLVAGFFVTVLYYPFFWVQLAMTVALYSITYNIDRKEGDEGRYKRRTVRYDL
ncbi:MAG: O-antigen ligase family protein [Gammaproteobacteria bacterium]|nr:O-antigen ligase family protein [Gammaproteobacteria bacterium]